MTPDKSCPKQCRRDLPKYDPDYEGRVSSGWWIASFSVLGLAAVLIAVLVFKWW